MGRRQARDHPHPRRRRRQADRGFDAARRHQSISWRARRAAVIAASGRVSRAVAGAGPRCSGGKPQGDDSDGHGAGGTRPLPRAFRASRRGAASRGPGSANAAARHDGRGAGGSAYHRGLQRRLLFHRQQRSDPVCGGRKPGRTATRRSCPSFARGVRSDRACRELCGSLRPRNQPVRRSCGRSRASCGASRSGLAHLFGGTRQRWGL